MIVCGSRCWGKIKGCSSTVAHQACTWSACWIRFTEMGSGLHWWCHGDQSIDTVLFHFHHHWWTCTFSVNLHDQWRSEWPWRESEGKRITSSPDHFWLTGSAHKRTQFEDAKQVFAHTPLLCFLATDKDKIIYYLHDASLFNGRIDCTFAFSVK